MPYSVVYCAVKLLFKYTFFVKILICISLICQNIKYEKLHQLISLIICTENDNLQRLSMLKQKMHLLNVKLKVCVGHNRISYWIPSTKTWLSWIS